MTEMWKEGHNVVFSKSRTIDHFMSRPDFSIFSCKGEGAEFRGFSSSSSHLSRSCSSTEIIIKS